MSSALNSKKTIVISAVVFILSLMPIESFAGKDWELITQFPSKRLGFVTVVVDDEIYLIGGSLFEDIKPDKRMPGPFGLSAVEVYDPQNNRWRRVANMPMPRANAKVVVVNDTIYVFGGYSGKDNHRANMKFPVVVDAYDPETDTWSRKQDMPTPWLNFGIGAVAGKIYLIGGLNINIPELPTPFSTSGTAVVNGKIYVFGGYGEDWDYSTDVLVYDTGFRAVTAPGELSTRWGALKMEHQSQP